MIMKKLIYTLIGLASLSPFFTSCEQDLPLFGEDRGRLNFGYEDNRLKDSLYRFSFTYGPVEREIDTIKLIVKTMGIPADYDRPFALQQLVTGDNDAVPGVHYVAFDDPELAAKFYYVPAGAIEIEIPIVVKRDPSLKTKNYTLRVGFKPNDEFNYGSKEFSFKRIILSDQLIKPKNWDSYCGHFFGEYGPVKHQFMINISGEKWDDDYVNTVIYSYYSGDQNFLFYYAQKMYRALQDYNATHDERLSEAGGPVEFDFGGGFE